MEPLSNYDFEDLSKQLKSPEMLDKITALGSVRTFRKNEAILNEEAYIRSIPIVLSGSIKLKLPLAEYSKR